MKKLKNFIKRNKGKAGAIGNIHRNMEVISVARLDEYFEKNPIVTDQWISVQDKLPIRGHQEVLVFSPEQNVIVTAWCTDDTWFTYNSDVLIKNVTHWQPLPEPPK